MEVGTEKMRTTPRSVKLIVLVLPCFLTTLFISCSNKHPTDEAMIATFNRKKPTFETIRSMLAEDSGLKSVDYYWTDPADTSTINVSTNRILEYRKLLDSIGCHRGLRSLYTRFEIHFV